MPEIQTILSAGSNTKPVCIGATGEATPILLFWPIRLPASLIPPSRMIATKAGLMLSGRGPAELQHQMSDYFLRYIPVVPSFQPTPEAALAAAELLRALFPEARSVESKFFEAIEFVDAGGNWSGVRCPSCGADAEPWWADAMSEAHKGGFAALNVQSPCCETTVSLNCLDYGWPVGFARYVLQAADPASKGLSQSELSALGDKLGCPVKEIPVRI